MKAENVVAVKNMMMTSQMVQGLFLRVPYAVARLNMPIMAMCGGKLASAIHVRKMIPAMA